MSNIVLPLDSFQRPFLGTPTVLALDTRPRPFKRTADGHLVGAAIRPSAALEANYQARLLRLIDEMANSVRYWISAAYRREDDRIEALSGMAEDARPSTVLREVLRQLRRRWLRRFDEASQELARYFATRAHQRSANELKKILKRAGITVQFKISRNARDALSAIVQENVSLIRSIPEQYLTQVEGSVMRSVTAGRDLASLVEDLQYHHGVTRRRAEFIALHQNNAASGAIQRIQYLDMGIEEAVWHHSHAGKTPRIQHVEMDGKTYNVAKGMWDRVEKTFVIPGQLPSCRCFNSPVLSR